ncbi:cellulose synthase operon protein YhjQ/BcsQ [Actinomyces oris]|uniref:Cellulose synthase operon protein YhjQ/BcsQ n=1 Tax=Actinomyces oris TaxID=544580 RepID=A0AAE4K543_9ACTO|nr:cellulose synthase operon protein YhjQ/BcsQ [Actinomyces oris]MDT0249171.1 cellulose synthase operon protein YhjQ/BcsQ [Actinomyces oris]
MPVRQVPVPAGRRRGQPGQWEQSEETLTIPALEGLGEEAVQEPGEEAPASGVTGGSQVWDGRDVSFPPLRPSAGRPVHPGGEIQLGERWTSQGRARSGCSPSESPPEPPSEPLWASAPVGSGHGRRAAQVLAVTGARGGLGASVLLLHLAWALGRAGRRVAMMDLDPTGGLDLLCGQSVLTGLRWADLPAEESAFRPGHLVGALPVWHAMPVLTGDVRGGPLPCAEAVLEAMRAEHDVVLVDLPRGASPPPGAGVLVVTGLDLRSAVAAESIVSRLRGTAPAAVVAADAEASAAVAAAAEVPVWLVARQVGEDVVVEDLELITGCPVLGQVPTDRVLAKRLALGEDPVRARSAFRRAASALARELLPRLAGAATPVNRSTSQSGIQTGNQSVHQSGNQLRRQL